MKESVVGKIHGCCWVLLGGFCEDGCVVEGGGRVGTRGWAGMRYACVFGMV